MSATHTVQDATGVIARADGGDIIIATSPDAPGTGSGYSKGCIYINTTTGVISINLGDGTTAAFGSGTVTVS